MVRRETVDSRPREALPKRKLGCWSSSRVRAAVLLGSSLFLLGGCGASRAAGAASASPGEPEVTSKPAADEALARDLEPTLVTQHEATGLSELLAAGEQALEQGRAPLAEEKFRQAWLLVGKSEARPSEARALARARALFGLGTASDLQAHYESALTYYADVGALTDREAWSGPVAPYAETAKVRRLRILLHLGRYAEAGELASGLQPKEHPLEELVVRGARAMAKVSQPDPGRAALADASREIGYARELIESLGFDRVETPPVEVSVIFFALGEVERQRALSIGFDPDAPDFSARLEERCRHVLDGQAAYSQVMRSRNAHWSAMAGVRVGELYFELHRELLDMGLPRTAARQEQQLLYWGAMRLRYGILLDKAVKMMERTLEMLDRTGEPTPFRDRAEGYLLQLREAERAEDDAISALPYSRAQLRAVLQDLSLKNGGSGEI